MATIAPTAATARTGGAAGPAWARALSRYARVAGAFFGAGAGISGKALGDSFLDVVVKFGQLFIVRRLDDRLELFGVGHVGKPRLGGGDFPLQFGRRYDSFRLALRLVGRFRLGVAAAGA